METKSMETKSMETKNTVQQILSTFQKLNITKYKLINDPKFICATVYKYSEFVALSSVYKKKIHGENTQYFFMNDDNTVSIWFVPQWLLADRLINERTF